MNSYVHIYKSGLNNEQTEVCSCICAYALYILRDLRRVCLIVVHEQFDFEIFPIKPIKIFYNDSEAPLWIRVLLLLVNITSHNHANVITKHRPYCFFIVTH